MLFAFRETDKLSFPIPGQNASCPGFITNSLFVFLFMLTLIMRKHYTQICYKTRAGAFCPGTLCPEFFLSTLHRRKITPTNWRASERILTVHHHIHHMLAAIPKKVPTRYTSIRQSHQNLVIRKVVEG